LLQETQRSSIPRNTDNFFPPPSSEFISARSRTINSAITTQIEQAASTPASPQKIQLSPTSPKQKKKTNYVPPPPITASVASSATIPTKNTTTKIAKKTSIQHSESVDTEEGSIDASKALSGSLQQLSDNFSGVQKTDHKEEADEYSDDEEDDFGELVLNNDDFCPTVISTMTNDLTVGDRPTMGATQYSARSMVAPKPDSESGMRFDELYRLKGVLGTGAFSTVREGFHRVNSDISYAIKCINRKKLSEEDEAALLDEVAILKEMRHLHIIRLYDFFSEPATYYLVMERMSGGELFDRIVAKAYYSEKEARDTCRIILDAVGYCHAHHVAHRDLKPENLLLLSEDDDSAVKIADFGFAKRVTEHNSLTTQCGTPGYVAPEILEGTPYDERADMWSVGVILYILLGGYPPFIESTQRDLFRKIRKGDYEFHEEYWGTVSAEAKGLISSLLTVDASLRLTAKQGLENEWITGDDAKLANRDLDANMKKLRNFNAKRKFRAAVSTVMAANKLNSLGKMFIQKPFQTEDASAN
jgi:calcium/calmodulin-dependent protein kinase I